LLLVDALDHDFGLGGRLNLHAGGHLMHDGMGETQRKIQLVALGLSTVTHADQGQLALEALGHTGHHVVHQCAGRTRKRVGIRRTFARLAYQGITFTFDRHRGAQRLAQRAERPLDRDFSRGNRHFDTSGNRNRILSYT